MAFHLQVLGVQSDVLFPVTQQRELESLLKEARKCLESNQYLISPYNINT